jgi:hypothetical protein
VEQASQRIAEKYKNEEFAVLINRISEIENRALVPTLYKLYSLCAIYRLDFKEVLAWYGIDLSALATDGSFAEITRTRPIGLQNVSETNVFLPVNFDPGIDFRQTTYLSRMIQRWGRLPLTFLEALDLKNHRYAFIGSEDWFMYPLLQPESLVLIDETRRRVSEGGWANEFERPIYFLEHRAGYVCGWCSLVENRLILQPHPASMSSPEVFSYPDEIDVIGQVTGVAMRLDQARRRRTRS